MYKKHIEQMMTAGMKLFFDLDYAVFHHFFLVVFLVAGLFKLLFTRIRFELNDGVLTVVEDIHTLREYLLMVKQQWQNSTAYDRVVTYTSSIKTNLERYRSKPSGGSDEFI